MVSNPKVSVIFVNIFGGIMKCDVIAEGIVKAAEELNLEIPLIVRMKGTNEDLGKEILDKSALKINLLTIWKVLQKCLLMQLI